MKNKRLFIVIAACCLLVTFISGCATIPRREALATFQINGTAYLSLASLCDSRNIDWQYDTFTRAVSLRKESHKINLMVGDTLILVDGQAQHLKHPVDFYRGMIVVPYRFKGRILDVLFKETYPVSKTIIPIPTIKKIVIDAGHGGRDPGAIGRAGLREKDVNLDIAGRLNKLLKSYGIEVVMTRNSDTFISLGRRAEIANNSQADFFISIHANANRVRKLRGLEVYYVSTGVNDSQRALSSAKNAALNFDSACFAGHSLNLKAILWDMIYTDARGESIELSRSICKAIKSNLGARILGIKGARFQVLRDVRMPAVLIEVGFLSNSNEERMLRNGYYRQRIAEGIVQGICDYAKERQICRR